MNSYEVHGLRVSSSAVREALARGDMAGRRARCWGGRTASAATWCTGRKLGRELGFRTLNLRFAHWKPAASGIFAVLVHGLGEAAAGRAWPTSACGPSLDPRDVNGGRVLLETHCLQWPAGLGPKGPTVKSSAWNCCTNCTTSCATTVSMP
jgi:riboflavin kinase/FMN adenylyltransferase